MPDESRIWEIDCRTMTTDALSRRALLRAGGGIFVGGSLLALLAGCGGDDDGSSTSSAAPASSADAGDTGSSAAGASAAGSTAAADASVGAGKTIALSLNGFNTYDQNTAEGVLKALDGTGYKFIGAEAGFDATKEVANIKQLVARQPDGLIVLAASADGAARASKEAKDAGIPVVTNIWFPLNPEADAVYYAATQLEPGLGGKLVIDFIAKDQGVTEGKILEITGLDAQPFSDGYKQGLREALKAYPGLEIVASQQGFYTADGALKVLKPMLSAHPDANVIIDYAAEMGNAIAQELERQKLKDIVHITSDGNDGSLPWLEKEDGAYMKAIRWFSPADQGRAAAVILRNKLEKDEDPTTANIGLDGWSVVDGTKDPIVILTQEVMATAANIKTLPPFGYPDYTDKIPFGG